MPRGNRAKRRVPGEARADHRDVNAVSRGPEEIPAKPERIGEERNDVCP